MSIWYVYILQCADHSLYTGVAKNLSDRIQIHNLGKGAKYTRGRLPVQLVYQETAKARGVALQREFAIKSLPRAAKLRLIATALSE